MIAFGLHAEVEVSRHGLQGWRRLEVVFPRFKA